VCRVSLQCNPDTRVRVVQLEKVRGQERGCRGLWCQQVRFCNSFLRAALLLCRTAGRYRDILYGVYVRKGSAGSGAGQIFDGNGKGAENGLVYFSVGKIRPHSKTHGSAASRFLVLIVAGWLAGRRDQPVQRRESETGCPKPPSPLSFRRQSPVASRQVHRLTDR
jgi:hypothetical protein